MLAPPRTPVVTVGLKEVPSGYELVVHDNGVGMPQGQSLDETLGLRIVTSLAKQLGGSARVETENGTAWFMTFPGVGEGAAG